MKYQSGSAFRQALEARLREQSQATGLSLVRLRKLIAAERLLARLQASQPDCWWLKGGLALQWRLGNLARTTRDLDLSLRVPVDDLHQALARAAHWDLQDWFGFEVQGRADVALPQGRGLRFPIQCLLDSRRFENFHIDVAWSDPVVEAPEVISAPPLLTFAGLAPASILLLSGEPTPC